MLEAIKQDSGEKDARINERIEFQSINKCENYIIAVTLLAKGNSRADIPVISHNICN